MALSFTRETANALPEAYLFSEGFPEFEPLSEELDLEFGTDQWLEVGRGDAEYVLESARGSQSFAIITLAADEPDHIAATAHLIRRAREAGLLVLLVVGDISSRSMHELLREGVADFAPYPEPKGALAEAIGRLRYARSSGGNLTPVGAPPKRRGRVLTVYGVAGGVGGSTIAVNLAWELANQVRRDGRRVALLDFDFQYGSVATFLDVPRREAVYELVSEASNFDQTGLTQALSTYLDRLWVLTAPRDALPLDIVTPTDIKAIIHLAREAFDYVVIDMPQSLMNWSEAVYAASDQFITVMEIDMRSAQNMFRLLRMLKSENMDVTKMQFVMNRAPGMTDLSGKARVKRVADSLGISYSYLISDGGRTVANACDQGIPLAEAAKSNAVRKEIAKMAQSIVANQDLALEKAE